MEGRDPRQLKVAAPRFRAVLAAAVLVGGLSAAALVTAAGALLAAVPAAASTTAALRAFLVSGGWLWVPCWGGAVGALAAVRRAPRRPGRMIAFTTAVLLGCVPLVARPVVGERPERAPRTRMEKVRAIRRASYGAPAQVASLIPLSHDADADVREQCALALGRNTIVTDIEHPAVTRPSRYGGSPVRAALRTRLIELVRADSVVAVRAEAARALWNAPRAFGAVPEAAETLAAILDRAPRTAAPERLAWLALDAAAGRTYPALTSAVVRFAAATPDTALAAAAHRALHAP